MIVQRNDPEEEVTETEMLIIEKSPVIIVTKKVSLIFYCRFFFIKHGFHPAVTRRFFFYVER